jgi:hypothetical protein
VPEEAAVTGPKTRFRSLARRMRRKRQRHLEGLCARPLSEKERRAILGR